MKIQDYIKQKLEYDYLHTTINDNCGNRFVVEYITVKDGGVDPQWEISFGSNISNKKYCISFVDDDMPTIIYTISTQR